MAAAYWHFLIGLKVLEGTPEGEDPGASCFRSFLGGVQGPDVFFYPGGERSFGEVTHGEGAFALAEAMKKAARTPPEGAFAAGWRLHLLADDVIHPLVDRWVCERFPRRCACDPSRYPAGHHRVEWGIDLLLLGDDQAAVPLTAAAGALGTIVPLHGLVSSALSSVCGRAPSPEEWRGSVEGMIKYLAIFRRSWRLTGFLGSKGVLKRALYVSLVLPLALAATRKNPQLGVFIPVPPPGDAAAVVAAYTAEACRLFRESERRFA